MPQHRISEAQRQALRDWYASQYPRPRQKDCVAWYLEKYGVKITQATVSESLSERWKYLDTLKNASKITFRQHQAQWPILEDILFKW